MNPSFEHLHIQEVQLSYKSKVKLSQRPKVTTSREAYEILLAAWDQDTIEFCEEFKILLLNRANKVLGIYELSKGGVSGTVADPKLIFIAALKANACGIILAHNHPSGNSTPSENDINLTRKCREAGRFLEIQILDHIVLTSERYYSFADEGRL